MKLLVVEFKVVSYEYFMFDMQEYELFDLMELLPIARKQDNEMMRNIMWASLKPYLKNKSLTADELFPLKTDYHEEKEVDPILTVEEQQYYRERYKNIRLEKVDGK